MRAVRSLMSRAEPATREMDLVKSMAIEVERTLERETRKSFKAALNGEMYEEPTIERPRHPGRRQPGVMCRALTGQTAIPRTLSHDDPTGVREPRR